MARHARTARDEVASPGPGDLVAARLSEIVPARARKRDTGK